MLRLLILFLSNIIYGNLYNNDDIINGVWLSGAAYCSKEKYKTMKLSGPVNDFIYKETIYDVKTDLQGYLGILPSTKSIYIALRGSSSLLNWIDDFEIKKVKYTTYPKCNCYVHKGFYNSALNIKNLTINYLEFYKKLYPYYSISITGHSYGASVAQLLSMELQKEGFNVSLYNYGQPRVGDIKYAYFVNTIINDYWRVTHYKDIVPHIPPYKGFDFYHSCTEIFEDINGKLNVCSEIDCEDMSCSNQFKIYETTWQDHSLYLNHTLSCQNSIISDF